ncbi:MAG TPA: GspH/FimT family pseudopilin [Methylophilaceae bacterium]|nr:GspH/FimT family pseudopilin [Methylophilaceae bacterium]
MLSNQRAFTLVELMVSIVLLGIVLSLALPSYRTFVQNGYIRTTAESIQSGLQLARAEAVGRNTLIEFDLDSDAGWSIGCAVPRQGCPEVIQSRDAKEGSSSSIVVTPAPAGGTKVIFDNLGATVPAADSLTQIDIDVDPAILSADESRDLRIMIGIGGNSRMCDPNLVAPDTRAC